MITLYDIRLMQPDPRMADEVPGVADKEVIIDTAADSFVALSTSCNDVSGIFVEAVDDETERFMPIHWPSSYFLEPHTPAPPSPPKSIIGVYCLLVPTVSGRLCKFVSIRALVGDGFARLSVLQIGVHHSSCTMDGIYFRLRTIVYTEVYIGNNNICS